MDALTMALTPQTVVHFMLVLARLTGVLVAAPVFGHGAVPMRVRAVVAVVTAMGVARLAPPAVAGVADALTLAGYVIVEIATGALFGFAAQLLFTGCLMGAELAGVHMGLGVARVIDPRAEIEATPVAVWLELVALQVFLAVDGHHLLVRAAMRSFELVPPGAARLGPREIGALVALVGDAFEVAVRIAAPVVAALFIADTALGLLARAIPQLNVFIMGFAVKIGVGFLVLGAAVPFIAHFMGDRIIALDTTFLRVLGGVR
jgi:flagellar biosynthetic protein FliR